MIVYTVERRSRHVEGLTLDSSEFIGSSLENCERWIKERGTAYQDGDSFWWVVLASELNGELIGLVKVYDQHGEDLPGQPVDLDSYHIQELKQRVSVN